MRFDLRACGIAAAIICLFQAPFAASAPPDSATPAPAPDELKPVALARLVLKLPLGQQWLVSQGGMFCITNRTVVWNGGQEDFKPAGIMDTFRSEIVAAGLKTEGDPDNLFETTTSTADIAVAGMITGFDVHTCTPNMMPASVNTIKGAVSMTIDWKIYSRLQKQIIGAVHTTGSYELADPTQGGYPILLNGAFAANVKALAKSPELRSVLSGKPRGEAELVRPTPAIPIVLAAPAPVSRTVDDAVASVVLVQAGDSAGSGVLIARSGYVLTAYHVVGDATTVKLRWSDGHETNGEVVRTSKGRDIALIKTDSGAHSPLDIRMNAPAVGEPVYAVGALMGPKFQGTVTRGVVSAERVIDGYAYLQSDVTSGPGLSGGPLLDDKGRVVAITVQSMRIGAAAQGINLFVPIHDAMDFLSLSLR